MVSTPPQCNAGFASPASLADAVRTSRATGWHQRPRSTSPAPLEHPRPRWQAKSREADRMGRLSDQIHQFLSPRVPARSPPGGLPRAHPPRRHASGSTGTGRAARSPARRGHRFLAIGHQAAGHRWHLGAHQRADYLAAVKGHSMVHLMACAAARGFAGCSAFPWLRWARVPSKASLPLRRRTVHPPRNLTARHSGRFGPRV